ncbi:hypothetical protein ASPACDRAFT_1853617 [Aspergillus aculeatus ATCC 16872]|uniref:AB hydrolase-1 domain-containing protein n=1 Tax=Aspergillus aculeatus (strain ATCC 16872 / CBS 172.66 / WB 5094) TaxID=690307 RepID=A0A1L9X3L2_ASPA1|nr:uncharacterized protein ASPACDRAFT_1853617 [Aspergillus aculeatus ATCC 16872]OJK03055.1 hypothetical protein ASPACDRAFT_1853617 [Aspergillus aculeatus ATCC 16872]
MAPIIAFIPGAWLTPAFYQPFLSTLTETTTLPTEHIPYPSLDPNPDDPATAADVQTDTTAIRTRLRTLIESQGREVILVMHSYAGMPGAAAASGLSKAARHRAGKPGGVVGMIFVAAFLVPEGVSCAGLQGGALPRWILLDTPAPLLNYPDDPVGNFLPEARGEVAGLETYLRPHATRAFTSPQPAPAWAEAVGPGLAFVVTARDRAVPREAQDAMMAATGREWVVREIECSHCAPFVGEERIAETVRVVAELIRGFS